jgi:hypothetical protein
MKRLIFTFGVIGVGLCSQAAHAAAPAECFANPSAVFAAHPNATHASYTLRVKRSTRCWYADAFRTEAEAKAEVKPTPRSAATIARTPAPPPAVTAQPRHPRTAALAPGPRPYATAAAPAPEPRTTAAAPRAPPAIVQFPREIPPAIQISVNAQELSRLVSVDETPADFESRFSVSGYKARK